MLKYLYIILVLIFILCVGVRYLRTDEASWDYQSLVELDAINSFVGQLNILQDSVQVGGADERTAKIFAGMGLICNIPMRDIVPIVKIESAFNPLVTSAKSAVGIGQVFPPTASLFFEANLIHLDPAKEDLYDVETNLMYAFAIYAYEYNFFKRYDRALAAYQGGRRAGLNFRHSPREVDTIYVERVLSEKERLFPACSYASL